METKKYAIRLQFILLCLVTSYPFSGMAEPLRLTPEGPVGNPNDGFGMPLAEMRKQMDDYWTAGEINKFYRSGEELCSGLKRNKMTEADIKYYVETCIYVLSHADTTSKYPYGANVLVPRKARIAILFVGGEYLNRLPEDEYRKARPAMVETVTKLMAALRREQKAGPPVFTLPTADPSKFGTEGEAFDRALAELREQQRMQNVTGAAISNHKELPEYLRKIEANFVTFVEQEYRRFPPEKDEMETIIARAALPKEATERLKKLIPR